MKPFITVLPTNRRISFRSHGEAKAFITGPRGDASSQLRTFGNLYRNSFAQWDCIMVRKHPSPGISCAILAISSARIGKTYPPGIQLPRVAALEGASDIIVDSQIDVMRLSGLRGLFMPLFINASSPRFRSGGDRASGIQPRFNFRIVFMVIGYQRLNQQHNSPAPWTHDTHDRPRRLPRRRRASLPLAQNRRSVLGRRPGRPPFDSREMAKNLSAAATGRCWSVQDVNCRCQR